MGGLWNMPYLRSECRGYQYRYIYKNVYDAGVCRNVVCMGAFILVGGAMRLPGKSIKAIVTFL